MKLLTLALLTTLLLPFPALSCGVLTHNLVTLEAAHLFFLPPSTPSPAHTTLSTLLLLPSSQPLLQSGSFFPDWGYGCLPTTSPLSELAHWPPFLGAFTRHILHLYPSPLLPNPALSPSQQSHLDSLLNFLLAITSHQVADATWHGIRIPNGLVHLIAARDFGGDFSAAHTALDFGYDFLSAARVGRSETEKKRWMAEAGWKVPVKDVVEVYSSMGVEVPGWMVRQCVSRGLAAMRSEVLIGGGMVGVWGDKAPTVGDAGEEWGEGGVEGMVGRGVECWWGVLGWLEGGVKEGEEWEVCEVFRAIKGRGGAGEEKRIHPWHRQIRVRQDEEMRELSVEVDEFGIETYTFPPVQEIGEENNYDDTLPTGNPTYISPYIPFSHFGTSFAASLFPSPEDPENSILYLAVGAPFSSSTSSSIHNGELLLIPWSYTQSSPSALTLSNLSHSIPASFSSRFSTALTPLLISSTRHLAVSSPGRTPYPPSSPATPPFAPAHPAGEVVIFQPPNTTPVATLKFSGTDLGGVGGRHHGLTLTAAALDPGRPETEFLVVSAPTSDVRRRCERVEGSGESELNIAEGRVFVVRLIKAGDTFEQEQWELILPDEAKTKCHTTPGFDGFGHATVISESASTLWISAPGLGNGAVFGFKYDPESQGFAHITTIIAPEGAVTFGHSLTLHSSDPFLAISAPNEPVDGIPQVGVVRVYSITDPTRPVLVREYIPAVKERYGKFGRVLKSDAQGTLWVGSGWAGGGGERGAVWRMKGGEGDKDGPRRAEVAYWMVGKEVMGRFGEALEVVEIEGRMEVVVGIPGAGWGVDEVGRRGYGAVGVFRGVDIEGEKVDLAEGEL